MYNFNKETKVSYFTMITDTGDVEEARDEERFLFRELPAQLCEDRDNDEQKLPSFYCAFDDAWDIRNEKQEIISKQDV